MTAGPVPPVPSRGHRWQLAGALVALVAACAAVILLQPSQHKPVVISHRPTAASTASPAASASAGTSPARQEARSVNALLARSSGDRSEIVAAAVDIANCGDLSQDQEALESAARSRQMLLDQLSQLSTAKLPHSKGLVSMLTAAWRASVQSDNSYAGWAGDLARTGCAGQAPASDPNWRAAQGSDARATVAKSQFAAVWDPIAASYGLPQYTASRF
jgi:hypothetical protein